MATEKGPVCPHCGYALRTQFRQAVEDEAATLRCPECGRVHDREALTRDLPLPFEGEQPFVGVFRRMWWSLVVPLPTRRYLEHWHTSTRCSRRRAVMFGTALAIWYITCVLGYTLVGLLQRATIVERYIAFPTMRHAPWSPETFAQVWGVLQMMVEDGTLWRVLLWLALLHILVLVLLTVAMRFSRRRVHNVGLQVVRRCVALIQPVFLCLPLFTVLAFVGLVGQWNTGIGRMFRWPWWMNLLLLTLAWTACRGALIAYADWRDDELGLLLGGLLLGVIPGICPIVVILAFHP